MVSVQRHVAVRAWDAQVSIQCLRQGLRQDLAVAPAVVSLWGCSICSWCATEVLSIATWHVLLLTAGSS